VSRGRHPEVIVTTPKQETFFASTFSELIVRQRNPVF
jgi:hypothetical protein